jgi:hypothetical protein
LRLIFQRAGQNLPMSEFSVSYHIRADDPREVQQKLRHAKLSGIVFGPANGWLTFVPYANAAAFKNSDGPRFADQLCRLTGQAVLHYYYAEDHGWTFALARADAPLIQYACWWDPAPTLERDQLDVRALAKFAPLDALEPLLRSFDRTAAAEAQPASRFAELLGLPAYQWLSPALAQSHTEDLLGQGGRKLGTKPPSTAVRLQVPPNRKVSLARSDLSGREALDIIRTFMTRFQAPWHVAGLATYGVIQPDGRGVWRVTYRRGESGDLIGVSLWGDGRLAFHGDSVPDHLLAHLVARALRLPDVWLDSTDIAEIVARLPIPDGLVRPRVGLMALRSSSDAPLLWNVHFQGDRGSEGEFASWNVYVDAATGEVPLQTLNRRVGYVITPARRRIRDGDWEDLPDPE